MSAFLRAIAALYLAAVPAAAHEGIQVEDAYARFSARSGAVFMTINNFGADEDRLTAARTDVAETAGLHTHHEDANGVMQMLEVPEGFVIPGMGTRALARGGDHVMLMGLKQDLKDGDMFTMTLTFEHGGEVVVEVVVDNARKGDGGQHPMTHGTEGEQSGQRHQGHGMTPAVDTAGMTDAKAIAATLKAQFETPEAPLTVNPVVVEGDHALASWAQDTRGGRALLRRRDGIWQVVLCGGPDLRLPGFLTEHGVPAAERLSQLYNSAEDTLGADKVALSSSFEGVVMIGEH